MARPTKTQVQTGEYSLDGSPAINVAAKSTVDPDTLEYSLDGSTWHGTEETAPAATTFKPIVIFFT